MRSNAGGVGQRDEGVVVGIDALPPTVKVSVHVADGPEQDERLVNEVAPEIEKQPACLVSRPALAPAACGRWPPSLEPRFEPQRRPNGAVGHQSAEGEEIAVPP